VSLCNFHASDSTLKECVIGAPAGRFGLALLVLIIRTRVKGAIGPAFTLKR